MPDGRMTDMDGVDSGIYGGTHGDDDVSGRFRDTVASIIEAHLQSHPVEATFLGDHRFDDLLDDGSPDGLSREREQAADALLALDATDDLALSLAEQVDLETLRAHVSKRLLQLDRIREQEWNPLKSNPGSGIYALLAREFAPAEQRLEAVVGRLKAVPEYLAGARRTLIPEHMPAVHVETALGQLAGTQGLIKSEVAKLAAQVPGMTAAVHTAGEQALSALEDHINWLRDQQAVAQGDPRIGSEAYGAALWLALDGAYTVDELDAVAHEHLADAERRIREVAARVTGESASSDGVVLRALQMCVDEWPITDATVLDVCRETFMRSRQFVIDRDLVTVHDDAVDIIEMPEIHRGQAVAYCSPPGPLEKVPLPTFYAVAPTPDDWSDQLKSSFYREYNGFALENLSIHEGVPGHVLQLGHHRRAILPTGVRQMIWDGAFVEGWAVYSERMMLDEGYMPGSGTARERDLVELSHLKMELRVIANAILDIGVHAKGMSEEEAMSLMVNRAFQEEASAHGKWRRALMSYCQLTTYFAGSRAVTDVVRDLRAARPAWSLRQVHDAVLGHGSPSPRQLRILLDLIS
jgi:uncharacterized protein (DUF885 family)